MYVGLLPSGLASLGRRADEVCGFAPKHSSSRGRFRARGVARRELRWGLRLCRWELVRLASSVQKNNKDVVRSWAEREREREREEFGAENINEIVASAVCLVVMASPSGAGCFEHMGRWQKYR